MNHPQQKLPPCGNPDCCASTCICGRSTYGSGYLDPLGYWEHPCSVCAQWWDDTRSARIEQLKERGVSDEELASEEYWWATKDAWPLPEEPAP